MKDKVVPIITEALNELENQGIIKTLLNNEEDTVVGAGDLK